MRYQGRATAGIVLLGAGLTLIASSFIGAQGADRSQPSPDVGNMLKELLGTPGGVIAPFSHDGAAMFDDSHSMGGPMPLSGGNNLGIAAAADNIVDLQCPNGGFDWPYGGCADTFFNITAPITMGLLRAYEATGNQAYLDATIDGANHDLNDTWSYGGLAFSSFDPMWLVMLSDITGDPSWAAIAQDDFFERLSLGTYGDADSCGSTQYFPGDTHDFIARHKCNRSGSLINIRAWDMQFMPYVASQIGFPDSSPGDGISQMDAFINDSILDALNNLDENIQLVEIGLAGGVHALALVNHSSFAPINSPNYSLIDGIDNLCDLADALAGEQDVDGSWVGSTQFTAYAVLALEAAQDAGCGPYEQAVEDGRELLWSLQDSADGAFWSSTAASSKNIQVQGDVLMVLAQPSEVALNSDDCVTDGTLTVTIDMSDTSMEIVGGQFFLEYDTNVLSNPSVAAGDAPFEQVIFQNIDTTAGTIDVAVGVQAGNPGTDEATTMAVLTFDAAEACTVDDLVTFRPDVFPFVTKLTDGFGNEVLAGLTDLHPVTIDGTAPTFASVPDNITVPADAGVCTADVDMMPAGWELEVNAKISNGVVELRSVVGDPEGQWGPTGAAVFTPPSPMVFSDITGLSADFNMLQGCIVGGTPRFAIGIDSTGDGELNGHVVAHWGPEGSPWNHCPGTGWNNTGDLTASADPRWEAAQLGGGTVMTYTQVVDLLDTLDEENVLYVIVAVDGSWSQDQIILVDNVQIGSSVHTFANAIGNATAVDKCDNDPVVTAERDDQLPLDAPYPTGDTVITWTATDACGNFDTAQTTVTVLGVNEMVIDITLQATVASGPFDRCITFELTDANGNVIETVEATLTFSNGQAVAVIEVPCGDYGDCLAARGPLHTLRSTGDLDIVGTEYVADGFLPLRGGDLNDDGVIDILDFGIFVWQFGENYGTGDTDCTTPFPHADLTGNGLVETAEFTFIQQNFLEVDDNCPVQLMAAWNDAMWLEDAPKAKTSITVQELRRKGLGHLAVADLNGDGVVDEQDIALFLSGQLP